MIAWQDPPPYVQYMAEAEALSRMAFASGACGRIGYVVVDREGQAEFDRFIRRAVTDGISVADAQSLLGAAGSSLSNDLAYMSTYPAGISEAETEERDRDFALFLATQCVQSSRRYPNVIQADGDEPTTDLGVLERLAEQDQSPAQ